VNCIIRRLANAPRRFTKFACSALDPDASWRWQTGDIVMMHFWKTALGAGSLLAIPTVSNAADLTGLWRFDMVSGGGTTLGAMTIQTVETANKQAAAQHAWAVAKGRGAEWKPSPGPLTAPPKPGQAVYPGIAMTNQGTHGLPIESIEINDGAMTMVVSSPRGLVIFRGTVNADQTRFYGKATYWNGTVFDMRGVKQVQPL
jgi:hypothetical protein